MMSDCQECWETPCSCGWEYRTWSKGLRIKLAAAVLGVPVAALAALDVPDDHPKKAPVVGEGRSA